MKVFAYLRVSGRGQVEGDGFPRQRAAIEAFCAEKGWTVARWFTEPAVSGTTDYDDRPKFTEMLSLMGPGTTNTFVVECADRLARDLIVSEMLIAEVRKQGHTIYSAAGGGLDLTVNSDDPTRILIRQLMGALAQWDKSNLVRKLRAARDRKSAAGGRRIEGPKPFELKSDANKEASQWIFQMHETGKTFREIASFLNTKKVPAPGGNYWFPSTVYTIYARHARRFRVSDTRRVNQEVVDSVGFVMPKP